MYQEALPNTYAPADVSFQGKGYVFYVDREGIATCLCETDVLAEWRAEVARGFEHPEARADEMENRYSFDCRLPRALTEEIWRIWEFSNENPEPSAEVTEELLKWDARLEPELLKLMPGVLNRN
jgi:hypothetical protein